MFNVGRNPKKNSLVRGSPSTLFPVPFGFGELDDHSREPNFPLSKDLP